VSSAATTEIFPVLPRTDYPPLEGFWEAADRGVLAFPYCASCNNWEWYPGWQCAGCGGELDWKSVEPFGELHAATSIVHAFHPDFRPILPMSVGLFVPNEAPSIRMVVRIAHDGDLPLPGAPLKIVFERQNEDVTMPVAVVVS
jgi:uncharacterized OB-fold protein